MMCVPLDRVGLFHELSYKCPYTHMSYEVNNSFMFIYQSIIENVTNNEMSTISYNKRNHESRNCYQHSLVIIVLHALAQRSMGSYSK